MNKVLIVIDMQNDFVYGKLSTPEAREIVPYIQTKIDHYHANGNTVIFTKDTHDHNYFDTHEGRRLPVPHCMVGDHGRELVYEVWGRDHVIPKTDFGYSKWYSAIMNSTYRPDVIEIVGVCTDICVISNALILRALFPNTDIIVYAKCCAGTTIERHKAALDVMRSCHVDIVEGWA